MRAPVLLALGLFACAPAEPPPSPAAALDCALPYDTLAKQVLAQPGLVQAPKAASEPYRFYRLGEGGVAYVLTEPGAPGHPAVFKQEAVREDGVRRMRTTGCPYGDKAGFDQVMTYLQSLS